MTTEMVSGELIGSDPAAGRAIAEAWPGARLHTTTGLGHRRILRDAATVAMVSDFLTAP